MEGLDPEAWMALALEAARMAGRLGNVPVGAVVVRDGRLVASAGNLREVIQDPTAHAEILALRAASQKLGDWRLQGATLYVSLEPCAMCAHAIGETRIARVVFALREPRTGALVSGHRVLEGSAVEVVELPAGAQQAESLALMQGFFRDLRGARRAEARPEEHAKPEEAA
jgi:tRNA(adenine34) deaminase